MPFALLGVMIAAVIYALLFAVVIYVRVIIMLFM